MSDQVFSIGQMVTLARGRGKIVDNGGGIYTVRFADGDETRVDAGTLRAWAKTASNPAYDVTMTNAAGTPSGLRAARRLALAEAREAVARGHVGGEYRVKYDSVVYVVDSDGIHRLTKSPDGRTLSDRMIP